LKIFERRIAPFLDDAREIAVRHERMLVRTQEKGIGIVIREVNVLEHPDALCFCLTEGVKRLDSQGDGFCEAGLTVAVCLRLTSSSERKARLSHTNTREPAQKPSGRDWSMELRRPTAR